MNNIKATINPTNIKGGSTTEIFVIENILYYELMSNFKKQVLKCKEHSRITIYFHSLNILGLSTMSYLESLIYYIIKIKKSEVIIQISDNSLEEYTPLNSLFSSILFEQIIRGNGLINSEEFITCFEESFMYIPTEFTSIARLKLSNKKDFETTYSDIIRTLTYNNFFPENFDENIKKIINELCSNAKSHDESNTTLIIYITKSDLEDRHFLFEIGALNYCNKNITDTIKKTIPLKHENTWNEIKQSDVEIEKIVPLLMLVNGVSTRKIENDYTTFGGTGLYSIYTIHNSFKNYNNVKNPNNHRWNCIYIGNYKIDLHKLSTSEYFNSISSFTHNFKNLNNVVEKTTNPFNGIIYNIQLLIEEE